MSDGSKKGDKNDIPKPGAGGPGKVTSWAPQLSFNSGDIVTSDGNGWWVCTSNHVSGGTRFELKPGQSNDQWHYSQGAS